MTTAVAALIFAAAVPAASGSHFDDARARAARVIEACGAQLEARFAVPVTPAGFEAVRWYGPAPCEGREVYARTVVGRGAVKLCTAFTWLGPDDAADVLVHEYLHAAGLREAPQPGARFTSVDITREVRAAARGCRGEARR